MSEEVWDGNQGMLSVYVSKAKDLPNLSKLDKQDVMLRLRIAHMTRESDTVFRAGQTPIFKYLERFEITPELRPLMFVEVYSDRRKKVPVLIGRCEVDLLNGIRADPKEGYCTWYELRKPNNEFAGTVFIELTFKPSLPKYYQEENSRVSQQLDKSMAARPIPPLPDSSDMYSNDTNEYTPNTYRFKSRSPSPLRSHSNEYSRSEGYMHASNLRQTTPAMHNGMHSPNDNKFSSSDNYFTDNLTNNFSSSVGTNTTVTTQGSGNTTVTSTSDTKFHFANLRKLKEKINIFKNPSNISSEEQHKDSPVDIEALQKAIGVTNIEDDDESSTESFHENYTRSREISKSSNRYHEDNTMFKYSSGDEPALPPLPTSPRRSPVRDRNMSPNRDITHGRNRQSPQHLQFQSPKLPPLPSSRSGSSSPTRRRPPPS